MSRDHGRPVDRDSAERVRALLEGSLASDERDEVISHIRSCAACTELYDRVASAERALAGGEGLLGAPATLRVAERLGLDAPPPPPQEVRAARRGPSVARRRIAGLMAASLAVLLIAVVALVVPNEEETFTPRGGGSAVSDLGLRVFRLTGGPGDVVAEEIRAGGRIRRGDRLGIAYTNLRNFAHATGFVAGPGAPRRLDEATGAVRPGTVDEPLQGTIVVDDRFPSGPVRIGVVFSAGPLSWSEVETRARGADSRSIEVLVEEAPR